MIALPSIALALAVSTTPVGMTLVTGAGVSADQGAQVFGQLEAALRGAGFSPRTVGVDCQGDTKCIEKHLEAEGVTVIVSINMRGSARGLVVAPSLLSAKGPVKPPEPIMLGKKDKLSTLRPYFDRLAQLLVDQGFLEPLPTPPPAPVPDTPLVENPRPTEPAGINAPPPELTATPPPARSPAPTVFALVFGALALGAEGAALGLAVDAGNREQQARATNDGVTATHTQAEAAALVQGANDRYTVALSLALGGAALGVVGLLIGVSGR